MRYFVIAILLITSTSYGATSTYVTTDATQTLTNKTLAMPVITTNEVDGHTTDSLTAAQVSRTRLHNTGQGANDVLKPLPAAASGYDFTLICSEAQTAKKWGVQATNGNYIYLEGTRGNANGAVKLASPVVGYYLTCASFKSGASTYDWLCRIGIGNWQAE